MFGFSTLCFRSARFGCPHFLVKTKSTKEQVGCYFAENDKNATGFVYYSEKINPSLWVRDELFLI